MASAWSKDFPENRSAQWCTAIYKGENDKAASMLQVRDEQTDSAPWEASFRDSNFDLIVRLFSNAR